MAGRLDIKYSYMKENYILVPGSGIRDPGARHWSNGCEAEDVRAITSDPGPRIPVSISA